MGDSEQRRETQPTNARINASAGNMTANGSFSSTANRLVAAPLTAAAFAPYGEVIALGGRSDAINQGKGRRYPDLARMDLSPDGRVAVSLMSCVPEATPVALRLMERHPNGNQVFMPLNNQRYIVVVAPAGGAPTPESLRAFLCDGEQGINYHRGVWHHPMIALDKPCAFFEVHWAGIDRNCDEHDIAVPMAVWLPATEPESVP
jgi:ureidoglycolate lyase